jgi:hypothetical protein
MGRRSRMCPLCISTTAMVVVSVLSAGGLAAVIKAASEAETHSKTVDGSGESRRAIHEEH